MEVTIGLGGVIDIASGDELTAARDSILGAIPPGPSRFIPRRIPQAGVAATGAATVLDFGGPAAGRVWNIRYASIVGSDDHTTVAGATVASYVTRDPAQTDLTEVVDPGQVVPNSASWSQWAVFVIPDNHFALVVTGAANGQPLRGSIFVQDFRIADVLDLLNLGAARVTDPLS